MIAEIAVDLDAIAANAQTIAQFVAPARLAAVVKANAYGHGLVPVAQALVPHASRLCVYALEEAIELRYAGIDAPIHVLGPIPTEGLQAAHAANVAITLWDRDRYLREVTSVARRLHAPFRVQVKIDTGVVRFGIPADEATLALERYAETPELAVEGVFSHLAAAEELDSTFTHEQLARFLRATRDVPPGVERHVAATAAAMLWPDTRLDVVRAGIGLYGIWPSEQTETLMRERSIHLEPALTWRTRIIAEHTIDAGASVGYGRSWRAQRRSRIATLPIGYAEGLPRAAGNAAHVLVCGQRVPLVGRICMDVALADVTDVPGAEIGDPVTLIGRDGREEITAEEFAAACGTIAYELVARLPAHVPRSYVRAASASESSIVPS